MDVIGLELFVLQHIQHKFNLFIFFYSDNKILSSNEFVNL